MVSFEPVIRLRTSVYWCIDCLWIGKYLSCVVLFQLHFLWATLGCCLIYILWINKTSDKHWWLADSFIYLLLFSTLYKITYAWQGCQVLVMKSAQWPHNHKNAIFLNSFMGLTFSLKTNVSSYISLNRQKEMLICLSISN